MIGRNLAFRMGDGELTNQHPAQEIWWDILLGNLVGNSVGDSVADSVADSVGEGAGGKAYLRKAVIGGNLAFGMGDGQL